MIYSKIILNYYRTDLTINGGAGVFFVGDSVIWTAHHEYVVVNNRIEDIHSDVIIVWFEVLNENHICQVEIFQRKGETWELIEIHKNSEIDFSLYKEGNNPFCPYEKYTGKHYATCVFPQNLQKHPDGRCYKKLIGV